MVAQAAPEELNGHGRVSVELEKDLLEVGGLRDEVDDRVCRRPLTSASIAGSGADSRRTGPWSSPRGRLDPGKRNRVAGSTNGWSRAERALAQAVDGVDVDEACPRG